MSYIKKGEGIGEEIEDRGMRRNSREEWKNSRESKERVLLLPSPAGFAPRPV
jgi:hypothetical protein